MVSKAESESTQHKVTVKTVKSRTVSTGQKSSKIYVNEVTHLVSLIYCTETKTKKWEKSKNKK